MCCVEGFEGMRLAFWSSKGRGAWRIVAATSVALCVSGCSSGMSRFDFPSFNLTDNNSGEGNADLATTSSIPVPPESVYSSGGNYQGQVARATLPPPDYTPKPASYSPVPPPDRSRIARATYSGGIAPHGEIALRDDKPVAGLHIKVGKGDTLSVLSRRYGVPVETIMGANDLSDGRLHIGQELVIPGAKAQQQTAEAGAKAQQQTAEVAPPGETYKVQKGDTPYSIATKLGVSQKALMERNKLRANSLQIGQVLSVPAKTAQNVAANAPKETKPASATEPQVHVVKTTTITAPGAASSAQGSPGQGTSLAEEEDNQASGAKAKGKHDDKAKPAGEAAASPEVTGEGTSPVASNDQLPTPDPMSGNSFRWPVKGRVISEFGASPTAAITTASISRSPREPRCSPRRMASSPMPGTSSRATAISFSSATPTIGCRPTRITRRSWSSAATRWGAARSSPRQAPLDRSASLRCISSCAKARARSIPLSS